MNRIRQDEQLQRRSLVWRHHAIGWTGLLVFLTLGIVLETLHGLKLGLYLDVRHETRRLMWTLAHAHGTLLSLVNIVFAVSLSSLAVASGATLRGASRGLAAAVVFMPLGFFLGGIGFHGSDPGLGIVLVPVGALLMFFGVAALVIGLLRSSGAEQEGMGSMPGGDAERAPGSKSRKRSRK